MDFESLRFREVFVTYRTLLTGLFKSQTSSGLQLSRYHRDITYSSSAQRAPFGEPDSSSPHLWLYLSGWRQEEVESSVSSCSLNTVPLFSLLSFSLLSCKKVLAF